MTHSLFGTTLLAAALALGVALTGCSQAVAPTVEAPAESVAAVESTQAPSQGDTASTQAPKAAGPMPTTPFDLTAFGRLTDEQLVAGHRLAIEEGRIVAPGFNNVVGYQLAMRHRLDQALYQDALQDIAPEIVLHAEIAIERSDEAERARYLQMLEAIDPNMVSLERLKAMPLGTSAWTRPTPAEAAEMSILSEGVADEALPGGADAPQD